MHPADKRLAPPPSLEQMVRQMVVSPEAAAEARERCSTSELVPGDRVVINGLQNDTKSNGLTGVLDVLELSGYWIVHMDSGRHAHVRVKPAHLKLVACGDLVGGRASAAAALILTGLVESEGKLELGMAAVLQHLTSWPEMNGRRVFVDKYEPERDCWLVRGSTDEPYRVKAKHLHVIDGSPSADVVKEFCGPEPCASRTVETIPEVAACTPSSQGVAWGSNLQHGIAPLLLELETAPDLNYEEFIATAFVVESGYGDAFLERYAESMTVMADNPVRTDDDGSCDVDEGNVRHGNVAPACSSNVPSLSACGTITETAKCPSLSEGSSLFGAPLRWMIQPGIEPLHRNPAQRPELGCHEVATVPRTSNRAARFVEEAHFPCEVKTGHVWPLDAGSAGNDDPMDVTPAETDTAAENRGAAIRAAAGVPIVSAIGRLHVVRTENLAMGIGRTDQDLALASPEAEGPDAEIRDAAEALDAVDGLDAVRAPIAAEALGSGEAPDVVEARATVEALDATEAANVVQDSIYAPFAEANAAAGAVVAADAGGPMAASHISQEVPISLPWATHQGSKATAQFELVEKCDNLQRFDLDVPFLPLVKEAASGHGRSATAAPWVPLLSSVDAAVLPPPRVLSVTAQAEADITRDATRVNATVDVDIASDWLRPCARAMLQNLKAASPRRDLCGLSGAPLDRTSSHDLQVETCATLPWKEVSEFGLLATPSQCVENESEFRLHHVEVDRIALIGLVSAECVAPPAVAPTSLVVALLHHAETSTPDVTSSSDIAANLDSCQELQDRSLQQGVRATLQCLAGAPELNGQEVLVENYDEEAGCWVIQLANGQTRSVKAEKLVAHHRIITAGAPLDMTSPHDLQVEDSEFGLPATSSQCIDNESEIGLHHVEADHIALTGLVGKECVAPPAVAPTPSADALPHHAETSTPGATSAANLDFYQEVQDTPLQPGGRPTLQGLAGAPELDGQEALVENYDEETGCWEVQLVNDQTRSVNAEKLVAHHAITTVVASLDRTSPHDPQVETCAASPCNQVSELELSATPSHCNDNQGLLVRMARLQNLKCAPELNGTLVCIESFMEQTGVWTIRLEDGRQHAVRTENLVTCVDRSNRDSALMDFASGREHALDEDLNLEGTTEAQDDVGAWENVAEALDLVEVVAEALGAAKAPTSAGALDSAASAHNFAEVPDAADEVPNVVLQQGPPIYGPLAAEADAASLASSLTSQEVLATRPLMQAILHGVKAGDTPPMPASNSEEVICGSFEPDRNEEAIYDIREVRAVLTAQAETDTARHATGWLRSGARAMLCNLKTASHLNGLEVYVDFFDHESGNWGVQVGEFGLRHVKADNLAPIGFVVVKRTAAPGIAPDTFVDALSHNSESSTPVVTSASDSAAQREVCQEVHDRSLQPGARATLQGLSVAPELNGQEDLFENYDEEVGQWEVQFAIGQTRSANAEALVARPRIPTHEASNAAEVSNTAKTRDTFTDINTRAREALVHASEARTSF